MHGLKAMKFSKFGQRFARSTGARELMDDLGAAMSGGSSVRMLGGGNPAHIPEVQELLRGRLNDVAADDALFKRMLANYPAPGGEEHFRAALAALLNREYGWDLTEKNIALTGGSQSSFFLLFNLFAGPMPGGAAPKNILLPLTPEYIGYADLGVAEDMLCSKQPDIDLLDDNMFKYRVDFDKMQEAMNALSRKILVLQGDGDYAGTKALIEDSGNITSSLQSDLDRLSAAGIPVDIVFEQGVNYAAR